jgi:hypothetical protein
VSENVWLVERVECPGGPDFLHWVGNEGDLMMQTRFVTEWPPTEEDLDFGLVRIGEEPVVVENREVGDLLVGEGLEDAEVRPFHPDEQTRADAWRPFALVERLIELSEHVTIDGARSETIVPFAEWSELEGTTEIFPRLLILEGPGPFHTQVLVRPDGAMWRVDIGPPPSVPSLESWLESPHVRFNLLRTEPARESGWSLSGIDSLDAAERFVIAMQAVAVSSALVGGQELEETLECSLMGPVRVRVLTGPSAHSGEAGGF